MLVLAWDLGARPRNLRFDSLRYKFGWTNLASSKKKNITPQ